MSAREELAMLKAALKAKRKQFRIDAWKRARQGKSINRYAIPH
jgi:hypothetical protein